MIQHSCVEHHPLNQHKSRAYTTRGSPHLRTTISSNRHVGEESLKRLARPRVSQPEITSRRLSNDETAAFSSRVARSIVPAQALVAGDHPVRMVLRGAHLQCEQTNPESLSLVSSIEWTLA
nr:hypothetical protein CFP56_43806 [Quercus suber]